MIKTREIEQFPCWAIYYACYGEDDDLAGFEKRIIDDWFEKNNCYFGEAKEGTIQEFDKYPLFGLPCRTQTIIVVED